MRPFVIAGLLALVAAVPSAAAARGTAQNFLQRAERLMGKGPLALVDGDYKRLKREGTAAGESIQADRVAAQKAGRPILYCSPQPRAALGNMEFINGLKQIPQAQRERMSLKAAMLVVLQKKYPCKR